MHHNIKFFVNSQRCSENFYFEKLSKYPEETKAIIIKYDEMRGDIHLVPWYFVFTIILIISFFKAPKLLNISLAVVFINLYIIYSPQVEGDTMCTPTRLRTQYCFIIQVANLKKYIST